MTEVSPHAWLEPRLAALFAEAAAAGIARDVAVAVTTDLVNGKLSAPEPAPTGENPDQDLGEPAYMVNHGPDTAEMMPGSGEPIGSPLDQVGRHRLRP